MTRNTVLKILRTVGLYNTPGPEVEWRLVKWAAKTASLADVNAVVRFGERVGGKTLSVAFCTVVGAYSRATMDHRKRYPR